MIGVDGVVGKIIERNWVRLMTDVILTEAAGRTQGWTGEGGKGRSGEDRDWGWSIIYKLGAVFG